MTKTHLIEDQTIGGLQREYVETDRKADVGDYVYYPRHGDVQRVIMRYVNGVKTESVMLIYDVNYRTLEPTDIVHYADQRYRLVDRKASVGEKVVITNEEDSFGKYTNGDIIEAQRSHLGGIENDCAISDRNSSGYIRNEEYRVLVPVDKASIHLNGKKVAEISLKEEPIEVDASQASPEVIAMLANLAQRIVALEEQQRNTSGKVVELTMRYDDEIDVLHANQKRLAEEMANKTAFDADEVSTIIVELAKLLAEAHRKGSRS